jgi:hypothetical protein
VTGQTAGERWSTSTGRCHPSPKALRSAPIRPDKTFEYAAMFPASHHFYRDSGNRVPQANSSSPASSILQAAIAVLVSSAPPLAGTHLRPGPPLPATR